MKLVVLIIISIISMQGISQSDTLSDSQLLETFQTIHKTDRSNIKHHEVRKKIFLSNFNLIITIIKQQGFPSFKIPPKRKKDRNVIQTATSITFFHILQTEPDTLLDKNIISLLKTEIDEKRMPKHIIEDVLINWKRFNDEPKNTGAVQMSATTTKAYSAALTVLGIELQN